MNNLTTIIYRIFQYYKAKFELLNELIKRQSELHTDISRVINNHQIFYLNKTTLISTIQIIIITPKNIFLS